MDLIEALNENAIHATLADLVSINSVNPHFPGGPGERELADYIVRFFQSNNVPYEYQPVCAGRTNIVAKLEGQPGGRTVLLEAHMDTATELGMRIPSFQPKRDGKRLYGRGSCDTKGGLAGMMHAMKALATATRKPPNSVVFLAAVDEEHLFRGVNKFIETKSHVDGAIVAEPTNLEIVTASKGIMRWRFTTQGRMAHSSKPHLGVNAISAMAKVIVALDKRFSHLHRTDSHPVLGSPTMSIGLIRGGNQVNQVPDSCVAEVDRRWIPGETRDDVLNEFRAIIDHLRTIHPEIEVNIEPPYLESCPLETAGDSRIVRTVSKIKEENSGSASLIGVSYGSDAAALSHAKIPAIILGPGSIDQAHGEEEYVELNQVTAAARIYLRAVAEF